MSTRVRSWILMLAVSGCLCSAPARVFGGAQAAGRQPAVTAGVVYGFKDDGLALVLDVYRPERPNGAGIIAIASGLWQSDVALARVFAQTAPPLNERGFTVFVVTHGSRSRYPLASVVADVRRAVRFIRQHAKEYGVDPDRIGVFGDSSGGHLALLLGTTGDSGNPSASDPVLRESSEVAAVVANYPATDLARLAVQQPFLNITAAEAAELSPTRFVSARSAPSLIVHGDADTTVLIEHGERMYEALRTAGVATSFMPIRGAGHGFEGADAGRAFAALTQWFEQQLGVQPSAEAATAAAPDGDAGRRAAEGLRERQRQARIDELRLRFVVGPVFVMACGGGGTSNSLGAVVIPGAGTVYFNPYRLSGRCGTLAAENGVLVAPDGGSQRLSAPVRGDDVTIAGEGWTFKAAAGWVIREGARRGDYEVVPRRP
ncbi:MAG: alpha/beta hydrolase fold domain-containing protein [Vicinamibacterales bacterium]|jgi:acetyl esterase/lipase